MLPISLIRGSHNFPVLVELKSGETYNGTLVQGDNFMNLVLSNVIITSKDGTNFLKTDEVFLRGNMIKYLRIADEALDVLKAATQTEVATRKQNYDSQDSRNARYRSGGTSNNYGGRGGAGEYSNKRNQANAFGGNTRGDGNYRGRGNGASRGRGRGDNQSSNPRREQ